MNTTLSESQRQAITQLAGIILPGTETQPAAVDIELAETAIDRVLKSRPDLSASFCALLERFDGDAEHFLQALADAEFDLLLTLICAAYVMDDRVKQALGYSGQQALTPNRGGFGAEELVIDLMQQPKRFREV